ncbi:hypothetical protein KKA15_04370 [Patescibacteria group bacterium]|nr:hypothetical protein [Patescibacteria group bacterium]
MVLGAEGDNYYFINQAWWLNNIISNASDNGFVTDYYFYPNLINKLNGIHGIFSIFLVAVTSFILPLITSYNLAILFLLALTSFSTFLLTQYLVKNNLVSFLTGVMVGFSPFLLSRSFGHLNLLTFCFVPFFVLYLFKYFDLNKKRYLYLAILFFILNAYSSWYYLIFLTLFLLIFLIFKVVVSRKETFTKQKMINALIFVVTTTIFITPLVYLFFFRKNPSEIVSLLSSIHLSSDVLAYVIPPPFLYISTNFFSKIFLSFKSVNPAPFYLEQFNFLGYLGIILTLLFFFRTKKTKCDYLWIIIFFIFFILSLGGQVLLGGQNIILTPYYLIVEFFPALSILRVPARLAIFVILATAMMSAVVLAKLFSFKLFKNKILLSLLFILLLSIIIFERLPYTMYVYEVPNVSGFYYTMAQDKEKYAIVEIPYKYLLGSSIYNYHQTIHRKRQSLSRLNYNAMTDQAMEFYLEHFEYKDYTCNDSHDWESVSAIEKMTWYKENNIKYIILNKEKIDTDCREMYNHFTKKYQPYKYFQDQQVTVYKSY